MLPLPPAARRRRGRVRPRRDDARARAAPAWLSPLMVRLLGVQMRRASIPALARVSHRLGIDADRVLFGHVAPLGRCPATSRASGAGPAGARGSSTPAAGCGSRCSCTARPPPHPYWPGGAVVIDDGAEPRAVGLLDHLSADVLRNERHRRLVRGSRNDPTRSEEERRMARDLRHGRRPAHPALRAPACTPGRRRLASGDGALGAGALVSGDRGRRPARRRPVDVRLPGRPAADRGPCRRPPPSHRFAFSWGDDLLRFDLEPADGDQACVLRFTHVLDARDRAARDAAGWHVSLDGLEARLAGVPAQPPGMTRPTHGGPATSSTGNAASRRGRRSPSPRGPTSGGG